MENGAFTDQDVLARLAMGDDDVAVRVAAAEKLADEEIKRSVSISLARTSVRALRLLTDESLLAEIARNTDDPNLCAD